MNFKNKYRLMLHKAYFDKGQGLLYYVRYMILLFGLTSRNLILTFIIAFVYAVVGYILGWAYFHYGWVVTEQEVSNRYNKFVKEVRRKI